MFRFFKRFIIGLTVFLLLVSVTTVNAKTKDKYLNLQLFAKVLNIVQEYYVENVDIKKLIYGGLKGMLQELDPHTNFLTPDVFKEFESETSGEFGGLGIEITIKDDVLTIISPIEDAPAWKAGIKPGDQISSINGQQTKGFTLVDAAKAMKGKNGDIIKLGILRPNEFKEEKVFNIKRGIVKVKSVKAVEIEKQYHYFRISSFVETTHKELSDHLKKITKKESIKGIIIDLRHNPGGLLTQAIDVSDLFLSKGIIVSTVGRNPKEKEVTYAHAEGTYNDFPIVVIIDEYSASASEIVTGALKDNKRALVVGQKSFGKGSVQSVVKLGDGSALKLTVARYYTPSGKSIQAEGVEPDVVLESYDPKKLSEALNQNKVRREVDIKGHLIGANEKNESSKRTKKIINKQLLEEDYQVSQAFKYLKTWKVFKNLNF